MNTTQTSKRNSQVGSHISQRQNSNQTMQQEIDDLKRKLRHAQRKRFPSSTDISSGDEEEEDGDYRQRSRTPSSETFFYEDEHHRRQKHKGPSSRGLGNDVMSKGLDQIYKSPFTRKIEGTKLPRRFH